MKTARGMLIIAIVRPRASASPVSLRTSQGRAIMVSWSPSIDTTPPISSQRKFGLRISAARWSLTSLDIVASLVMAGASGVGRVHAGQLTKQRRHRGHLIGRAAAQQVAADLLRRDHRVVEHFLAGWRDDGVT